MAKYIVNGKHYETDLFGLFIGGVSDEENVLFLHPIGEEWDK